jgi:hypothetical protein
MCATWTSVLLAVGALLLVSLEVPGVDVGSYQAISITATTAGYACRGTVPVADAGAAISLVCTRR